jgi:hypothetical protein
MEAWNCLIHGVTAKCPFRYMCCDVLGSGGDELSPTLWDWIQPLEQDGPQASDTTKGQT